MSDGKLTLGAGSNATMSGDRNTIIESSGDTVLAAGTGDNVTIHGTDNVLVRLECDDHAG